MPIEILNGFDRLPDGSAALPNLAHGAETWALVRFTVPAGAIAQATVGVDFAILEAEIAFEANDGKRYELPTSWLALPVVDPATYVGLPEDVLVRQRAGELQAALFQDAAIIAAEQGDLAKVKAILEQAQAEAQGNPWIEAILASLQDLVAAGDRVMLVKEMKFSRMNLRDRLSSGDETIEYGFEAESEAGQAAFLRRKMRRGKREF
jgi:hypothetical protein